MLLKSLLAVYFHILLRYGNFFKTIQFERDSEIVISFFTSVKTLMVDEMSPLYGPPLPLRAASSGENVCFR